MKLVRMIKICLNEGHCKVQTGKHLSYKFPIKNCLKQGDNLSPMLFSFGLEYGNRKFPANQEELILNDTHQLLVYADNFYLLAASINAIKKIT
jgi:hypothetical protein